MFALSFLIVTAIIGAGFATGAELAAFFGKSTFPPVIIAFFVGAFLLVFMAIFLLSAEKDNQNGKFKKFAFNVLYFVFYSAMIAGIAELCGQATAIVAIIMCIVIVCFGFDRLLVVNYVLTVAILVVLLWIGASSIAPPASPDINLSDFGGTALSALLYSAMNCCMMEQLLRTARKKFARKEVFLASLFAACIVSFFVMLLLTAIRADAVQAAMPILALNNSFVTISIIFLAVMSSMYVALFNLTSGLNQKTNSVQEKSKLPFMMGISICAFICSLFGFTEIVGTLYPMVGAAIAVYALWSLISFCFLKKKN